MKTACGQFLLATSLCLLTCAATFAAEKSQPLRAGASATDVTPEKLPVIVNGDFYPHSADKINSPLHVRWLVLDDGKTQLALGVLDTCVLSEEFSREVKTQAAAITGMKPSNIMLSATHTHSAPAIMSCLGTDQDLPYTEFLLPRVVEGLRLAVARLEPARVGWAVASAPNHTHTRVWIRRPDKMFADPFGDLSVRAMMHPGFQNPDAIGPSGPSDPTMTILAVQRLDGSPLAVLANFSMHYFGADPISADYYGVFAEKLGPLLGAKEGFVGIMSQGTSGDQHWMDYGQPDPHPKLETYAEELAQLAANTCQKMQFKDTVPLVMREKQLTVGTRVPDARRVAWAKELTTKIKGRTPATQPEVYAFEQLWLHENPTRKITLQAVRIGELGIAIWPNEVFALSGLKIKMQSPLQPTMNIELANAEEGYIPPPELYPLGGYNTWPCRSASLETNAEPKIVEAMLGLLEEVGSKPRQPLVTANGPVAQAVLASKPLAYWRLEEWSGDTAQDASGSKHHATYEPGVARWLDGPANTAFAGASGNNHCPHLAGGYLEASLKNMASDCTVEFWFWNGLPNQLRPVTGYLFSRGADFLALGGSGRAAGKLVFGPWEGKTVLEPKTWHHVAVVRAGQRVAIYLDGQSEPEISGQVTPETSNRLRFGADARLTATWEGKLDEIAVFNRALSTEEIRRHTQGATPGAMSLNLK